MPNSHPLYLEVLPVRPDLDAECLEGSACTLRVSVEPAADRSRVDERGLSRLPETRGNEPDSRFLSVVRRVLANLLASQFFVLLEPPDPVGESWYPEAVCRNFDDTDRALVRYSALAVSASARDAIEIPLTVWAIPTSNESGALGALNRYRRALDDRSRWRKVIQAGVVAITVYADTCTLAFDCDQADEIAHILRTALDASRGDTCVAWLS